jgi:hypothetical protein
MRFPPWKPRYLGVAGVDSQLIPARGPLCLEDNEPLLVGAGTGFIGVVVPGDGGDAVVRVAIIERKFFVTYGADDDQHSVPLNKPLSDDYCSFRGPVGVGGPDEGGVALTAVAVLLEQDNVVQVDDFDVLVGFAFVRDKTLGMIVFSWVPTDGKPRVVRGEVAKRGYELVVSILHKCSPWRCQLRGIAGR